MKSISFIHLWNNYSGSPNVLATVADGLHKKGYNTTLISSFNNDGFLSNIDSKKKINVSYRFKQNIVLRFFQFMKFQFVCSFQVLKLQKQELVYINTILPFLPAIVAKMRGMTVIYHIHETYPKKSLFHAFCFYVAEKMSKKIICVSKYVKKQLSSKSKEKAVVIYNSVSNTFLQGITERREHDFKTILMISSARKYKGIFEFCEIAKRMPKYKFILICDIQENEINKLFINYRGIENLQILPAGTNLHTYYASSNVIVNFSNPQLIIETFGLTILEGMHYGLPAIVPPVGGITELVEDGVNGYKIDVNNPVKIMETLNLILDNEILYANLSAKSLENSKKFSVSKQINQIHQLMSSCYEEVI